MCFGMSLCCVPASAFCNTMSTGPDSASIRSAWLTQPGRLHETGDELVWKSGVMATVIVGLFSHFALSSRGQFGCCSCYTYTYQKQHILVFEICMQKDWSQDKYLPPEFHVFWFAQSFCFKSNGLILHLHSSLPVCLYFSQATSQSYRTRKRVLFQ